MRINKKVRRLFIYGFWLFLWAVLAAFVDNEILLASPWETADSLIRLLQEPVFLRIVGMSLLRIAGGFFLGSILAVLLAGLAYRHHLLEELLSPMVTLMKTVPVASFVVLLLIWWGSARLSISICFLMTFPQIYQNTLQGLKNTDIKLLEMVRVYRVPLWNRLWYLYRPAMRPFFQSGLRLALGMCWKAGVAAEVIGTPRYSIGEQLYFSKIYLDTAGVLAWTLVVLVLSIVFERLILWLTGRMFAWEPECLPSKSRTGSKDTLSVGSEEPLPQATLTIKHLSKRYGSQEVLQDVSAVYRSGQTYLLTSPSGSGKTTLLRLLCGCEQPDAGEISWESSQTKSPVERVSGTRTSSPLYSMVFQEDRLCEEYSALRNVELVLGDRERAGAALLQLLEAEALDKPCNQLSGGMKRRVALVRAVEAESDILLLDEPFTGMDETTRQRAQTYIRTNQRGRVILLATHIT